jgi:hypothetical protein
MEAGRMEGTKMKKKKKKKKTMKKKVDGREAERMERTKMKKTMKNNVDGKKAGRMERTKTKKKKTMKKNVDGRKAERMERTKMKKKGYTWEKNKDPPFTCFSSVIHQKSPAAWRRNFTCSFANRRLLTFSHYLICIF